MSLSELLAEKREALVQHMMSTRNEEAGTSEDDTLQFIRGFVDLVERGAGGDLEAMEMYLETVVPAIKAAGMPLPFIIDGMVRVAMSYTAVVPQEHHRWVVNFCGEYASRLMQAWEAA